MKVVAQSHRIGSQEAHAHRRGSYRGFNREEREQKTHNFLRNLRQKESRQTTELIARAGRLTMRRVERKRNRLRAECRALHAPLPLLS